MDERVLIFSSEQYKLHSP